MKLAVASDKFARGLEEPGAQWKNWTEADGYPTYDWRCEPGTAGNTAKIWARYEVLDAKIALDRRYKSDAHFVTYVVSADGVPLRWQPRINKAGLPWMFDQGFAVEADVLVCDVDNAGHMLWDDRMIERFKRQLDALEVLSTVGVYTTKHGYRLLQPLDEPISVIEVENYIHGWLSKLETAGIKPDWKCKDWTRHFRLPHVVRDS